MSKILNLWKSTNGVRFISNLNRTVQSEPRLVQTPCGWTRVLGYNDIILERASKRLLVIHVRSLGVWRRLTHRLDTCIKMCLNLKSLSSVLANKVLVNKVQFCKFGNLKFEF